MWYIQGQQRATETSSRRGVQEGKGSRTWKAQHAVLCGPWEGLNFTGSEKRGIRNQRESGVFQSQGWGGNDCSHVIGVVYVIWWPELGLEDRHFWNKIISILQCHSCRMGLITAFLGLHLNGHKSYIAAL